VSKKKKILLIDNDEQYVETTKSLLENDGYIVITAKSSKQGLSYVRYDKPDLILTELMLEKHDSGFIIARTLKADPLFRDIPIFMITAVKEKTGHGFSQTLDGYWMKTDDYAPKTIEADELVKRIKILMQNSAGEE